MKRNTSSSPLNEREEKYKRKNQYYKDIPIESIIDNIHTQKLIKSQLESLNQEVDNVIQKCTDRKATMKKELEDRFLTKQNELKQDFENTIKDLEDLCIKIKKDKETDYKAIFNNIFQKLKSCASQNIVLNKQLEKMKLNEKKIKENIEFYDKQIQNEEDLNTYLKIKLKMLYDNKFKQQFLNEIEKKQKAKKNKKINIQNTNTNTNNKYNIKTISTELSNKLSPTKYINTTSSNQNNNENDILNSVSSRKKINHKIYLTHTDTVSESNNTLLSYKKQYNSPLKTEISKLEGKDYINSQIKRYLDLEEIKVNHEIKKMNKLQKLYLNKYNTLKKLVINPFTSALSLSVGNYKKKKLPALNISYLDSSNYKYDKNNSNYNNNNSTDFSSSEDSSVNLMNNFLTPVNKKNIVINFLENQIIKKYIYDSLYQIIEKNEFIE